MGWIAQLAMGLALVCGLAACGTQENIVCKDYCDKKEECSGGSFDAAECKDECPEIYESDVLGRGGDAGVACTNQKDRREHFRDMCLYESCSKFNSCLKNIPECER